MNRERVGELRERHIAPVRHAARRLFGSEDGRRVLEALERAFVPGDLASGDMFETTVRAARADVIAYLRAIAEEEDGE